MTMEYNLKIGDKVEVLNNEDMGGKKTIGLKGFVVKIKNPDEGGWFKQTIGVDFGVSVDGTWDLNMLPKKTGRYYYPSDLQLIDQYIVELL